MRIAIVSFGFNKNNIRLQPWRYVYEHATRLPELGIETTILTDQAGDNKPEQVSVLGGIPLRPVGTGMLMRAMQELAPDVVLWPVGPRSIAFVPFLRQIKTRLIGYMPGPVLGAADFRVAIKSSLKEWREAALWMIARRAGWGRAMSKACESFVVMSKWNLESLSRMGISRNRIHYIPPGRDTRERVIEADDSPYGEGDEKVALFMGWPTKVRGIELLLDAFSVAARESPGLSLVVLARGEGTSAHEALRQRIEVHPNKERIRLIEGFLSPEEVRKHLRYCDFGILPFLIVPADRPLSFLEFFVEGKPVITTDAAGLPELVEDGRGCFAGREAPPSLAGSIIRLTGESDEDMRLRSRACTDYIREYPDWLSTAVKMAKVIGVEGGPVPHEQQAGPRP